MLLLKWLGKSYKCFWFPKWEQELHPKPMLSRDLSMQQSAPISPIHVSGRKSGLQAWMDILTEWVSGFRVLCLSLGEPWLKERPFSKNQIWVLKDKYYVHICKKLNSSGGVLESWITGGIFVLWFLYQRNENKAE